MDIYFNFHLKYHKLQLLSEKVYYMTKERPIPKNEPLPPNLHLVVPSQHTNTK